MELTKQKSEEQALHIQMIGVYAGMIDVDYMKEAGKQMMDDAIGYDSASVLNRKWSSEKGKLKQARQKLLINYVNT